MSSAELSRAKVSTSTDPRIPLSIHETWTRMKMAEEPRLPQEVMAAAAASQVVLQDFQPLARSLEWELSRLHWEMAGTLPFAEDEVPYLVNNTGRLSEDAATLLFHNCSDAPPEGNLVVVEIGAGCGLFARLFLAAFQIVCEQEGTDFFSRLRYIVSDASSRSVSDWRSRGVFAGFESHVEPVVCRADDPAQLARMLAAHGCARPRAVFCNYVLDVLPARALRRGAGQSVEEMHVRTLLVDDPALLREYTRDTVETLQQLVQSANPVERARLIPLIPILDIEVAFRPITGDVPPYLQDACPGGNDRAHLLVNTGAIDCLEVIGQWLDPDGFVLVNDYGPVDSVQAPEYSAGQRFGRTTAQPINFPLFDAMAAARWTVIAPEGDRDRYIHSRLLVRGDVPTTRESFLNRFSADAQNHFDAPLVNAREHGAAGRKTEALEWFRTAIARAPRDWRVLGEAAEFVGLDLRDFAAGVELARAALELNPWYSTWLWNVLGDCLYSQDRTLDAHEAYLQAYRINPRDPRTLLNLAYTWLYLGDCEESLRVIGLGLAYDRGMFRERLLEQQATVVANADRKRTAEYRRAILAAQRLNATSGGQPGHD